MIPKDLFEDLIKNIVAPYLKKEGLKKKALNFYKISGDIFYVINFQSDSRNSYFEHRFYVNCAVDSFELNRMLGNVNDDIPKYYDCFYDVRMNTITDTNIMYYELHADTNVEDFVISLMSEIKKVVRYFNTINSTESLVEILLNGFGLMRYEEVLLYLIKSGNMQRMNDYAKKLYAIKPTMGNRWPFFEKKVNDILATEGFAFKLEEFANK